MKGINYKKLKRTDMGLTLFAKFNRYQEIKKCWRKENGDWKLKEIHFIEQWGSDEYKDLVEELKDTIEAGGVVFGAFKNNYIVGFASLENLFFGSQKEYLLLSGIHVSYENRGMGIGAFLFALVCEEAIEKGAKKLYISAHSSQETRAFYDAMGCVEAKEYNESLVAKEPYDCQLEYSLTNNS